MFSTGEQRVGATRQLLMRGVSQDEYHTMIDILRRMAENLEHVAL